MRPPPPRSTLFPYTTLFRSTGVDLLRGLAVLLGWDVLEVPGMTSFHDTDYIGQGRATADALDKYDLVFSHIEADRKSTRLNSSHRCISYAVFCLKNKNERQF